MDDAFVKVNGIERTTPITRYLGVGPRSCGVKPHPRNGARRGAAKSPPEAVLACVIVA